MNFWNLLLENNAYLLIFSAAGFILSLIWYILSERRRRGRFESKMNLTDEASFFSQFEELENPALKIPEFYSPARSSLPHSVRTTKSEDSEEQNGVETEVKSEDQVQASTQDPEEAAHSVDFKHDPDGGETPSAPLVDIEDSPEDRDHDEKVRAAILRTEALKFRPALGDQHKPQARGGHKAEPQEVEEKNKTNPQVSHEEDKTESPSAHEEHKTAAPHSDLASTHFDEDEQKVKELLEQIKKDMREQGEQTS